MGARMGSVMDLLNVNASMGGKEIYVILKLILVRNRKYSLTLSDHTSFCDDQLY